MKARHSDQGPLLRPNESLLYTLSQKRWYESEKFSPRGSAPHPARAAALDPLFTKKPIFSLHLIGAGPREQPERAPSGQVMEGRGADRSPALRCYRHRRWSADAPARPLPTRPLHPQLALARLRNLRGARHCHCTKTCAALSLASCVTLYQSRQLI